MHSFSEIPIRTPESIVADGQGKPRGVSSGALPALYEDLLHLVFEHFDCETVEGSAACASCALVCRAWTEPSAKVLWRSLRGWIDVLSPLYNILRPFGKSTVDDLARNHSEASLVVLPVSTTLADIYCRSCLQSYIQIPGAGNASCCAPPMSAMSGLEKSQTMRLCSSRRSSLTTTTKHSSRTYGRYTGKRGRNTPHFYNVSSLHA